MHVRDPTSPLIRRESTEGLLTNREGVLSVTDQRGARLAPLLNNMV